LSNTKFAGTRESSWLFHQFPHAVKYTSITIITTN